MASFLLSGGTISLFFPLPKIQPSDSPETRIRSIIAGIDPELSFEIRLIEDNIPVLFSFYGPKSKPCMAVSTGLIQNLSDVELDSLLLREVRLLGRPDLFLFTAASFLPFLSRLARWWLLETSRISRFGGRTGTSGLGAEIIGLFTSLLELPLLPVLKIRHRDADTFALNNPRIFPHLPQAIRKTALGFIKPVESGAPFRKRVYQSAEVFFPYSVERWTVLKSYQQFTGGLLIDENLLELAVALEKKNDFFREKCRFQNHYPISRRFPPPSEIKKDPAVIGETDILCRGLKSDLFYGRLPFMLLLAGILLSILMRGFFGFPLILASAGILLQKNDRAKKEKTALSLQGGPHYPVTLQGTLKAFKIPGEMDGEYFYLKTPERSIPLVLRQLFRSEDPLFSLSEMPVEVKGVLQTEELPYLDISSIKSLENKEKIRLRSARPIIELLGAAGLFIAGLLLLIIEKFPLHLMVNGGN